MTARPTKRQLFIAAIPGLVRDALVFGGLIVLAVGAGNVYGPAGIMVLGAGLFAIGYWGLPTWGRRST